MNYSTTYLSQIVFMLGFILKFFKIEIGSDDLTNAVTAAMALGGFLWTLYQRTTLQKAPRGDGDVNGLGVKTN